MVVCSLHCKHSASRKLTRPGPSGLTTLKECLYKGYIATVFEAQDHIGGIWRYDASGNSHSVYHGTVFNSARDTSAFSDFPFDPERYPTYFGHRAFVQYLDEYAAFFDLCRHIHYSTKVIKSEQTNAGGWLVTYEQHGTATTATFDALFACTGHLSLPNIPKFPNLADFKGEFCHNKTYRTPGPYEGKRVAVIGIGSTGR